MELGEIYVNTEESEAILDVRCDKPLTVSLIVQDKLGKPCFEKQFNLEKGNHALDFPVANLRQGSYFVWLHYGNNTKMASFKINASLRPAIPVKRSPLLSLKFFSW